MIFIFVACREMVTCNWVFFVCLFVFFRFDWWFCSCSFHVTLSNAWLFLHSFTQELQNKSPKAAEQWDFPLEGFIVCRYGVAVFKVQLSIQDTTRQLTKQTGQTNDVHFCPMYLCGLESKQAGRKLKKTITQDSVTQIPLFDEPSKQKSSGWSERFD